MLRASLIPQRPTKRRVRWRVTWLQWFALFALIFATPIPQLVASQVVSLIAQETDDCADGCKDKDCCPGPCQICHCCAHANALTMAPFEVPAVSMASELVILHHEDLQSSGYALPPFRPPTV